MDDKDSYLKYLNACFVELTKTIPLPSSPPVPRLVLRTASLNISAQDMKVEELN